jgi:hypothetical protein
VANYLPKSQENMRVLARLGVDARAKERRKDQVAEIAEIPPVPAELLTRPNLSGGSHDNDWRCPYCRNINSIKRHACAECGKTPANGRMTKSDRRVLEKEHRTQAYLGKFGL